MVYDEQAPLSCSFDRHFLEYASNKTPDGSDMVVVINADGYIQGTS